MIVTPHMTRAHSAEESLQHEGTSPGMAHFAGTGPGGTVCRQCRHWNRGDILSLERHLSGLLKPAPCGKYETLTGLAGFRISGDRLSCRHFERSENLPPYQIDPMPKTPKAKK